MAVAGQNNFASSGIFFLILRVADVFKGVFVFS